MQNKHTGKIILFYLLMFLTSYGENVETLLRSGYDFDKAGLHSLLTSLLAVLIVSVIMMAVPFICKTLHKNPIPHKTGKKICLWNSIILFILSLILTTQGFGFVGGIGAILFYFINKWLFVAAQPAPQTTQSSSTHTPISYSLSAQDEAPPKRYSSSHVYGSDIAYVPPENNTTATTYTPVHKTSPATTYAPSPKVSPPPPTPPAPKKHYKYCSRCGNVINSETKKCTGCGKQYFKGIKWTTVVIVILAVLLVVSTVGNVYLYRENDTLYYSKLAYVRLYEEATIKIDELEEDLSNWKSRYGDYYDFYRNNYDKLSYYDEYIVFVIDDGTYLYHHYDCHKFIEFSGNYWVYHIQIAESDGYSPCPLCCD